MFTEVESSNMTVNSTDRHIEMTLSATRMLQNIGLCWQQVNSPPVLILTELRVIELFPLSSLQTMSSSQLKH